MSTQTQSWDTKFAKITLVADLGTADQWNSLVGTAANVAIGADGTVEVSMALASSGLTTDQGSVTVSVVPKDQSLKMRVEAGSSLVAEPLASSWPGLINGTFGAFGIGASYLNNKIQHSVLDGMVVNDLAGTDISGVYSGKKFDVTRIVPTGVSGHGRVQSTATAGTTRGNGSIWIKVTIGAGREMVPVSGQ